MKKIKNLVDKWRSKALYLKKDLVRSFMYLDNLLLVDNINAVAPEAEFFGDRKGRKTAITASSSE